MGHLVHDGRSYDLEPLASGLGARSEIEEHTEVKHLLRATRYDLNKDLDDTQQENEITSRNGTYYNIDMRVKKYKA